MNNIFLKAKLKVLSFMDNFSPVHLKLEDMVKANDRMLKSHLKLCKESNEGIYSLKSFGEHESPGLKQAFINLSDSLKSIEVSRTAMVHMLESSFVGPLKELAQLQRDIIKAETYAKGTKEAYDKAKETVKGKKEKPKEDLREGELEKAEAAASELKEESTQRDDELKKLKIKFEKNKIENMKRTITLLVQEYKKLHSNGVQALNNSKEFIDSINVQKESTSAILYPVPHLESANYVSGIKALRKKIRNVGTRLEKVQRENIQLLNAHIDLQEETRSAINLFKEFAKEETPGIQKAIENFSDGLETIESNREAFVKQMKFEFIEPIKETGKEEKDLEDRLETILNMYKEHVKWKAALEKIRAKPNERLKEGELEEAKENVARYEKIVNQHHNILTQNTHLFTLSKIEAFKNSLMSILERNLQFHEQAVNIIANTESMAKDIQVKEEFKKVKI